MKYLKQFNIFLIDCDELISKFTAEGQLFCIIEY